jgi:hypothetical protein
MGTRGVKDESEQIIPISLVSTVYAIGLASCSWMFDALLFVLTHNFGVLSR